MGVLPELLSDQHLIAECRELKIPYGGVNARTVNVCIFAPTTFTLGKGHISFWYDKQVYLERRHAALVEEGARRGFKISPFWDISQMPSWLLNDYEPTAEDTEIIRDRIAKRLWQKPEFYRYYGKSIQSMKTFVGSMYATADLL